MKVGDVMTHGVEFAPADATIQEAATIMAEQDVGALPIGAADAVEGILTDRDIILRVVVAGLDPRQTRVRDVMSSTVFRCRTDDTVDAALRNMREHQVRRLPVEDDGGRIIGIVSLSDLAKAEPTPEPEKVVEALREVAEPHRQTAAPADR